MQQKTIKLILAMLIVAGIAWIVASETFKKLGLTMDSLSKFKYKGVSTKKDWYTWIIPIAKTVGKEYGIPWQAIAVQTAVETGWGKSVLTQNHNNFGGIKFAGSGAPSFAEYNTTEYFGGKKTTVKAKFASWPTPYEGLKGYANFFHRNKRYKTALQYPTDPIRFIEEIKKAGYATDPVYVSKLTAMLPDVAKYA